MADKDDMSLEDIIAQTMQKKKEQSNNPASKSEPVHQHTEAVSEETKRQYQQAVAQTSHKNNAVQHSDKKKKKRWSKKKKALLIAIILIVVIGILIGAGVMVIYHYIGKINIVDDNSSYEILSSIPDDDDLTSEPDSPQEDIDKVEETIRQNMENGAIDFMQDEDVTNILLIGTDARDNTSRGRSDSMILFSINKKTEKIIMTSFMRDTYLAIPGVESTRLNHAYAYGGPDLLIDTLEQNFKINIDRYVQVNFFSFINVVDSVGGVDIDVTDAEVDVLNTYIDQLCRLEDKNAADYRLSKGGSYTLNGIQALGYSRIRYIGNADFQRTERQRTVLEKIIGKMKNLSLTEMSDLLDLILPKVTTNMQEGEIFSLILNSSSYLNYDREQCRVPADNTWEYLTIRSMSVLGVDFDANIAYLKEHIYNEK